MTLDGTGNVDVTNDTVKSDWRLGMWLWLLGDSNGVGVANDMTMY